MEFNGITVELLFWLWLWLVLGLSQEELSTIIVYMLWFQGPMMSICFREGIKIKPDALDQIIIGSNQDIRQILHHLSMWSANDKNLQVDDMKREAEKAKKDFKMVIFVCCLVCACNLSIFLIMKVLDKVDRKEL